MHVVLLVAMEHAVNKKKTLSLSLSLIKMELKEYDRNKPYKQLTSYNDIK
jgi:hypothetical protein